MDNKELAQGIVRNTLSNINGCEEFHDTSFIYKKTNERLQDINDYFNVNSILSVIGSGDQVIASLLNNPDKIRVFDISVFPSYFLKLKLGAIEGLSREEFIKFFFEDTLTSLDEYYDDLYFDKISKYLDNESKEFWDYLFNFNDWYEIYNSPLFSSENVSTSYALIQNNYLENDNFEKLKVIIPDKTIIYETVNLLDLDLGDDYYDLIYLSNIYQYLNLSEYKDKVNSLSDNADNVITYVFGEPEELSNYLESESVSFNGNGLVLSRKKNK